MIKIQFQSFSSTKVVCGIFLILSCNRYSYRILYFYVSSYG